MGAISATDIISIIQSEIENFDFDTESRETGEVIYVATESPQYTASTMPCTVKS